MEIFAFIENAVGYEDQSPEAKLRSFDEINLGVSKSAILGVAGIAAATAVVSPTPQAEASVRLGETCAAVGDVQQALNDQGFSVGTADNIFGARTFEAVQSFQADKGLAADGIVGTATAAALGLDDVEASDSPFLAGNSCSTSSGGGSGADLPTTSTGVVTPDSGLVVRTGAGLRFSSVGNLASGTAVTYDRSTQTTSDGLDWVQITSGSFQGRWVAASFLAAPDTATDDDATTDPSPTIISGNVEATPGLVIRDGAGLRFASAGSFDTGTTVRYIEGSRTESDDLKWVEVADGDFAGKWIAEDFLTTGTTAPDTPDDGAGDSTSTVTGVVSTSGDPLMVRSDAGLSAATQGSISNGQSITYKTEGLRIVDDLVWIQLVGGDQDGGWVAKDFVR
ncbi:MAG: peptidoglycan-binding protein [Cyanobacteria bacterium P01_E01_bin.6]